MKCVMEIMQAEDNYNIYIRRVNINMSIYSELEALYVERGEVKAKRDLLLAEQGYNDEEFEDVDYELYIIERAIDELEWKIYIMNGGH